MKKRSRWRQTAVFIMVRSLLALSDRISVRQASAFGRWAGRCYYTLNPSRRDIAIQNLLRTQVAASREEAARIARRSFEHFGMITVETMRIAPDLQLDQPVGQVIDALHPETRALLDSRDEGAIVVMGHIGNWEAAGRIMATRKPVSAAAATIRNPRVNDLLTARRAFPGLSILPKRSTKTGRLLEVLRNREILAIMMDQRAKKRGRTVDFFGIPARCHSSPAVLHLYTGAPLCFVACLREPDGRLRLEAPAPIRFTPSGSREDDIRAILQRLNRYLETVIRAHPEQYLWAHRRWHD